MWLKLFALLITVVVLFRGDGEATERQKPGRKPGAELKRKRASLEAAAAAVDSAPTPADGAADVVLTDEAATAQFANALLTGQALYEANTARLNTLGVPGPPAFLQPIWPSYMDDLPTREKVYTCLCQLNVLLLRKQPV